MKRIQHDDPVDFYTNGNHSYRIEKREPHMIDRTLEIDHNLSSDSVGYIERILLNLKWAHVLDSHRKLNDKLIILLCEEQVS